MTEHLPEGIDQFDEAEKYWLAHLSGQLTETRLLGDVSGLKPGVQETNNTYNTFEIEIDSELTGKLLHLSNRNPLSLYILFLTVFKILLFKCTGQEDIIVGSPVHKDSYRKYNNYVALRDFLYPEITFKNLLLKIKDTAAAGYKNGYYPIDHLADRLEIAGFSLLFRNVVVSGSIHDKELITDIKTEFAPDIIFFTAQKDNHLTGSIIYNTKRFKPETIKALCDCYLNILTLVINNINLKLADIRLITGKEKQRVLYEFNRNGKKELLPFKAIHEFFEHQAEKNPQKIAVSSTIELVNIYDERTPGQVDIHLSYEELNEKANQLARRLKEKGVKSETIVGLLVQHPLEKVVSILAVLKAGGAYLPIDAQAPDKQINHIFKESNCPLIIVEEDSIKIPDNDESWPEVMSINDTWIFQQETTNLIFGGTSLDIAGVMFTSGTTGKMKGILVPHQGIINYTSWRLAAYQYSWKDVTLQLLSYCFDGFGSNFYSSLASGGTLVMIPDSKKIDFKFIKQTIIHFGVTNTSLIPVMFEQLLEITGIGELTTLRFVVLAGEKSSAGLIKKSWHKCPGLLLVNEYGPTETTVAVASHAHLTGTNTAVIGRPIANTRIYILDHSLNPLPINLFGELCVEGKGVTRGYLNKPELTKDKFTRISLLKDAIIYRTGDLARWLPGGTIEYLSRIDHQVKIRGYRIEPEHIEQILLKYEDVQKAIVITKKRPDSNLFLCAYIVADRQCDPAEIKEYLAKQLPDYMIPSYIVPLTRFPLNSNGKVNRNDLPEPETLEAKDELILPRDEVEKKLAAIWNNVLSIDKNPIGIRSNFFDLGGHSLKVTMLVAVIHKQLHAELQIADVFENPTIEGLAQKIRGNFIDKYASIQPAEKKEYYVLASAQKRMYILRQVAPGSVAYNTPQIAVRRERPDRDRLEQACQKLIKRHESLRVSFEKIGDEPVQRIHQDVEFKVDYYEMSEAQARNTIKSFVKPFDLGKAPLLRISLVKIEEKKYVLLADMHHIVTDGVSMETIFRDFQAFYEGKDPGPLPIQYKDFAQWQNKEEQLNMLKIQENYWLNEFQGDIPQLNLPTDYPRPPIQSYEGDFIFFEIDRELTEKIKCLLKETGTTLSIFLLSVYHILLGKYSGQSDIVVGLTITGRTHADLQDIVGMFVNVLPIRAYPQPQQPFTQFLEEVKLTSLQAYKNQDYPFDNLVAKLGLYGDQLRNPLFDAVFQFLNIADKNDRFIFQKNNDDHDPFAFEYNKSVFDLFLEATEVNGLISLALGYSTALFKRSSAEVLVKHYLEIISRVPDNPRVRLEDITITSDFLMARSDTLEKDQSDFRF